MGRPREFDEQRVIQSARETFWANGVAATSVSDLSEATGISVGSLYKAFDSKAEVCHRALDDYLDVALDFTAGLLSNGETPLDSLNQLFDAMAERASDDSPTRGCYAVAMAGELAETDAAVRERLRVHDRRVRGLIADRLRLGVAAGQFDCDPEVGARMLATTINGVQVEARKGITYDEARSVLGLALKAIT